MAERKYTYNSTKDLERVTQAQSAFNGMLGVAKVGIGLYEQDRKEKEIEAEKEKTRKEVKQNQINSDVEAYVKSRLYGPASMGNTLESIKLEKDVTQYDNLAQDAWASATDAETIARDLGVSTTEVMHALGKLAPLRSDWQYNIEGAKKANEIANIATTQGARTNTLARDTSMSLSENISKQKSEYAKTKPDSWDFGGDLDPNKPKNQLYIANVYSIEQAKKDLPQFIMEHPTMTPDEVYEHFEGLYKANLDSLGLKGDDAEAIEIRHQYEMNFRGLLEGSVKSDDPGWKSYDAIMKDLITSSATKAAGAEYDITQLKKSGSPVGLDSVEEIVKKRGLSPENYFDAQQIASMLHATGSWNLAAASDQPREIIAEFGEENIKAMMMESAMSTEKSSTITMDGIGYDTSSSEGDSELMAGIKGLARTLPKPEGSIKKTSIMTKFAPLIDRLCEGKEVSDESRYELAVTINGWDEENKKVILARFEDMMQDISTDPNLTTEEKYEKMRPYYGAVPTDKYQAAWDDISFAYAKERDNRVLPALKSSFQNMFPGEGTAMYNEFIHQPGVMNSLEEWMINAHNSDKGVEASLDEFVTSNVEVFLDKKATDLVISSGNKIMSDVFGWTDPTPLHLDDTPIYDVHKKWLNGDYALIVKNDKIPQLEEIVKTQLDTMDDSDTNSMNSLLDATSKLIYGGLEYDKLSETQVEVVEANLAVAMSNASISKLLEKTFGKEVLGKETHMCNLEGFGRAMVDSDGYIYAVADNDSIYSGGNDDVFVIGKLHKGSSLYNSAWAGETVRGVSMNPYRRSASAKTSARWGISFENDPVPVDKDPILRDLQNRMKIPQMGTLNSKTYATSFNFK